MDTLNLIFKAVGEKSIIAKPTYISADNISKGEKPYAAIHDNTGSEDASKFPVKIIIFGDDDKEDRVWYVATVLQARVIITNLWLSSLE